MDDSTNKIIEDTADICLEILGDIALCRECTIDPEGSIPEVDFPAYTSRNPEEFAAHLLKHIALRHRFNRELADASTWEELLTAAQRPQTAN